MSQAGTEILMHFYWEVLSVSATQYLFVQKDAGIMSSHLIILKRQFIPIVNRIICILISPSMHIRSTIKWLFYIWHYMGNKLIIATNLKMWCPSAHNIFSQFQTTISILIMCQQTFPVLNTCSQITIQRFILIVNA